MALPAEGLKDGCRIDEGTTGCRACQWKEAEMHQQADQRSQAHLGTSKLHDTVTLRSSVFDPQQTLPPIKCDEPFFRGAEEADVSRVLIL